MNKYNITHIIELLKKVSPRFDNSIAPEHELYADCGLDSREFINVIREIELLLKHDIDDEDLLEAELITINDLINFINTLDNKFCLS
ncbi:MAG: phosphopantetheine-binding protein [Gammaproteobacteria bacterium]